MSSPPNDDLKQRALVVFGKVLSDDQLELYKGRLPTMLQNVERLDQWSKRLGNGEPAQIQCLLTNVDDNSQGGTHG